MNNNKKILIIKEQNKPQYQINHPTQKKIVKHDHNQNLSESRATTTSSVSSITKNNNFKGNNKTPKKKNIQIPVKKMLKPLAQISQIKQIKYIQMEL